MAPGWVRVVWGHTQMIASHLGQYFAETLFALEGVKIVGLDEAKEIWDRAGASRSGFR